MSLSIPTGLPSTPAVSTVAFTPTAVDPPADLLANLLARARRDRRLLSVHLELTHRCNEHCRHCFLPVAAPGDANLARHELTTAAALALIDQIADLGALYVTFSGGEPLLRADFFTLAAHARRRRLALRVYTNGQILGAPSPDLTPAPADQLAALHPLAVAVSIYAAGPAVHDAITGVVGSWEASLIALRRLRAVGVHTICKTPLMAVNAAELPAVRALAATLGAAFEPDPIITAGVGPTRVQRRAPLAARMSDADLAQVLGALLYLDRTPTAPRPGPQLCAIGRSSLAVDPYGNVFPCVEVRRPLGSVRHTPLAAIWHDTAAWAPYLRLSAGPAPGPDPDPSAPPAGLAALPACRTCRLSAYCVRCHGAAANETGDLYGPSPPHCRAARLRRLILQDRHSQPQATAP